MSLDKIIDKAKSIAESTEVFESRQRKLSVNFENNQIKDSSTSDLSGVAVRVIKNGKIGFSSSSKPDDDKIADIACELAKYGKKAAFDFSENSKTRAFDFDMKDYDSLDENKCITECERAMNELKSLNKDFLVMSSIIKNQSTCHILTSKGLNLSQRFVKIGWMCGFSYNTEGNFLTIYDYRNESNFTGFDDLLKKVKGDYLVCQNNETVKSGKYRVLFSPRAFMHMMMVFSSCLSGFAVAKKISPWAGKIDEKLFDERVSIISDLVSANSSFRKAVDDEGTPTGRLTLIDKGILKSFYHSRDTAFQCGQSPTGHAYRARYLAMPLPSLDGTILASGTADTEEMKTKAEIWVDDLMGTMTSNPYSGIISGNIAMGYVMENGKRRARIKDAMLSINIFDAFRNSIIAISKESQRYGYPGFASVYDAPWLLFDGIPVSA